MIQRIQSIFYLIAALCAGSLFFLPIATSDKAAALFLEDKVFNVQDHNGLIIIAALAVLLPLIAMFLFKNRPLQLKLGALGMIFPLLLIGAGVWMFLKSGTAEVDSATINLGAGLFLPIAVILFGILANRFVKKDEDLVQSSDRLR